ncbi:MFS transporter [Bosea sp. LjRoot237]|uniref:MFS transporter n=1 Tax=Bosea sp. LjRoot237 TaxID=3342292 RepID=UPI003ECF6193
MRRVAFAAFLGTALEWYDFFIYGAVAALVFNKIFFPSYDPTVGILLSFATFAVGFIARPLGALLFGHMGDTVGRKKVLVITMLLMGVATVGIGLLPSYDQIGISAPILLIVLRILQGLALGGEWGGAVLMTAEHGDAKRKGYNTSFAQIGVPIGNLLSVGVIVLTSMMLSDEQFVSWGWRVPFLLSTVLIVVGLWVRSGVEESPEFAALSETRKTSRPLVELLKSYPRQLMIACFIRIGTDVAFYIFSLFVLTYVTSRLGLPKSISLNAVLIASAIQIAVIPAVATLSDSIGRKPVFLVGSIGGMIWVFFFFSLIDTRDPTMITVAICVAMTCWAFMYGPLAAFITELFPTHVRYSGISLGFQLAGILGGGIAPLIATTLLREFQTPMAIAWYVAGALALTTISILLSRETSSSRVSSDQARVSTAH